MTPPISAAGTTNPPASYNPSWNGQQPSYGATGYTPQATQGVQTDSAAAQAQAAVRRPGNSTNSPSELSNVDFGIFVDEQNTIAPAAQASQSSYAGNSQNAAEFQWSTGNQPAAERPKRR